MSRGLAKTPTICIDNRMQWPDCDLPRLPINPVADGGVLDVLHKGRGVEGTVEHVAHPEHQASRTTICLNLVTETRLVLRRVLHGAPCAHDKFEIKKKRKK